MDIKKKLGKRIKELRLKKNISQEYMAEVLDINPSNYSRIETGSSYPRPENLEKICEILDVLPKNLFDFEHLQTETNRKNEILNAIYSDNIDIDLLYRIYQAIKK